jgi:glycosyltransferase 2 family protein
MKIRISKNTRTIAQSLAAVLVVALVVYFFRNQFIKNLDQLQNARFRINYLFLALSLICMLLSYLVITAMWQRGVNLLASGRRFSFTESVGMVNTTQLTKYIPGKVWGYAMQMVLVDRSSVPVSAVLYINLLVALTNSFIALITGGLYFCLSSLLVPRSITITATAALLLAYVFFLLFNARFFMLLLRVSERILKRRIVSYEIGLPDMMRLQIMSVISAIAFGLSAVLCTRGIGFDMTPQVGWSVFAGFLFSDTVGFLAFFVPGGIGIREGLFYLILREHGAGPLALILPIAIRLLSMLVDALLGLLGSIYLRKYMRKGAQ